MSTDMDLYRVWPDGWVQDASEDEDAALAEFERRDAARAQAARITHSARCGR